MAQKILSFVITGLYLLTLILIFLYPVVKRITNNENVLSWFRFITIALPFISVIITVVVLILNMFMNV